MSLSPKQLAQNNAFTAALNELMSSLCTAFAGDQNVITGLHEARQKAADLNTIKDAMPDYVQTCIGQWSQLTNGEWVWKKDAPHLIKRIRDSDFSFFKMFNLEYLFLDAAAAHCRDALWYRIQVITRIASEFDDFQATGKVESSVFGKKALVPTVAAPAATAAPASGKPPTLDASKIQEALKTNLPVAMDVFKSMMNDKSGENPLASILQMMKDPSVVGPDLASNIAGMAMGQEPASVFDETEGAAVNARLDRLEADISAIGSDVKRLVKALGKSKD